MAGGFFDFLFGGANNVANSAVNTGTNSLGNLSNSALSNSLLQAQQGIVNLPNSAMDIDWLKSVAPVKQNFSNLSEVASNAANYLNKNQGLLTNNIQLSNANNFLNNSLDFSRRINDLGIANNIAANGIDVNSIQNGTAYSNISNFSNGILGNESGGHSFGLKDIANIAATGYDLYNKYKTDKINRENAQYDLDWKKSENNRLKERRKDITNSYQDGKVF